MRASASASCRAALKIGAIGPKLDLTYPVRASGRRAADAGRDRRRPARLRRGAEGGEEPDADPRRRARCARPDGAAIRSRRSARPQACGLVREGWNGFNVLHLCGGARRRPRSRLRAAARRPRCGRHSRRRRQGRDRGRLSARRRRDRHGASSARPSSSIRAITAMPARTAPMSSCRAPPIPKNPRPM